MSMEKLENMEEIDRLARELHVDWFNHPSWWFRPTHEDDEQISMRFGRGLCAESFHACMMQSKNLQERVGYVILFDQVPRHVFRGDAGARHVITYYLQQALCVSDSILRVDRDVSQLSDDELAFVLLPLRHSGDFDATCRAINIAMTRAPPLKRFVRAALERMPLVRPLRISQSAQSPHPACSWEHVVVRHPKVQNPKDDEEEDEAVFRDAIRDAFRDDIRDDIRAQRSRVIIVSISGGVDSMVLSHLVLRHLVRDHPNVVFVHINYCNKPTCHEDEAFVTDWCTRVLHRPLFVRRIHELQREPCMLHHMRELYETYTRNVRFSVYKQVHDDVHEDVQDLREEDQVQDPPCVMMGHNKDDCFENVMTNITKRRKHDLLEGMQMRVMHEGIEFVRPLLNLSKASIRAYARKHGVPHLHDSTPGWSQRGKIRDAIVPALNAWDPQFIPSMHHLARTLSDMYSVASLVIDDLVSKTTITSVGSGEVRFEVSLDHAAAMHRFILKEYLVRILTPRTFSNKSFECFFGRLSTLARGPKSSAALNFELAKGVRIRVLSFRLIVTRSTPLT